MGALRQQMEQMVNASDDDWVPISQTALEKRMINLFRRLVLRLWWTMAVVVRHSVLEHWQRRGLQEQRLCGQGSLSSSAAPPPPPVAKSATKPKNRRDDLVFVGEPLQPSTACDFPKPRSECPHTPARLTARGTKSFYWWTCLDCGSRWKRVDSSYATDGRHSELSNAAAPVAKMRPQPKSAASTLQMSGHHQQPAQQVQQLSTGPKAAFPKATAQQTSHYQLDAQDEQATAMDFEEITEDLQEL